MYFDFVIDGSKSINSLTTSKLVSMVKSCLRMFLIFSSCNTNIKMFCSDNFLPLSWEQNVQKHSNKCSVSSLLVCWMEPLEYVYLTWGKLFG